MGAFGPVLGDGRLGATGQAGRVEVDVQLADTGWVE